MKNIVTPHNDKNGSGRLTTLIVIPPFGDIDTPSVAAHTLEACAKKAGFDVALLYANFIFAGMIGKKKI